MLASAALWALLLLTIGARSFLQKQKVEGRSISRPGALNMGLEENANAGPPASLNPMFCGAAPDSNSKSTRKSRTAAAHASNAAEPWSSKGSLPLHLQREWVNRAGYSSIRSPYDFLHTGNREEKRSHSSTLGAATTVETGTDIGANRPGTHAEKEVEAEVAAGIKIVTYNVLGPLHGEGSKHDYAPESVTKWSRRRDKVIDELRLLDADVLCLQEVSQKALRETYIPGLKLSGLECAGFAPSKPNPRNASGKYAHKYVGCATFANPKKLRLLGSKRVHLKDWAPLEGCMSHNLHADMNSLYNPMAMAAWELLDPADEDEVGVDEVRVDVLNLNQGENEEEKENEKEEKEKEKEKKEGKLEIKGLGLKGGRGVLLVGNTHLYWNPARADIKVLQSAAVAHALARFRTDILGDLGLYKGGKGDERVAVVIAGDFNTPPTLAFDPYSQGLELPDSDITLSVSLSQASTETSTSTETEGKNGKSLDDMDNMFSDWGEDPSLFLGADTGISGSGDGGGIDPQYSNASAAATGKEGKEGDESDNRIGATLISTSTAIASAVEAVLPNIPPLADAALGFMGEPSGPFMLLSHGSISTAHPDHPDRWCLKLGEKGTPNPGLGPLDNPLWEGKGKGRGKSSSPSSPFSPSSGAYTQVGIEEKIQLVQPILRPFFHPYFLPEFVSQQPLFSTKTGWIDHIWCSQNVHVHSVLAPPVRAGDLNANQKARAFAPIPNKLHPSDHLPLGVRVSFRMTD